MQLTLDELLRGRDTSIKNKNYFSTAAYVEPFIERMSKYTDNFICQAKLPDQVTLSGEGDLLTKDITYNRVWVQAVLPDEFDNHSKVVGMVYGLDVRKPVFKIYLGALHMACLNLCIFNPDFLQVQEIEPETAVNYKAVTTLMDENDHMQTILTKMKNTEIPYDNFAINENLGQWVRNALNCSYDTGYGKVKVSTATAVDAYKLLYENEESPYYVKPGETTSMFNIYNSFTELITNDGNKTSGAKDIMNKAEKTLLVNKILSI